MKYVRFAMLALLTVSLAAAKVPGSPDEQRPVTAHPANLDWSKIEQQYVKALHEGNAGVQASAASYIRKYRLSGAVDDLKEVFCKDCPENVRMSVAYALVTVGGEDGRTAVEKALKSEENEIVALFYHSILTSAATAQD